MVQPRNRELNEETASWKCKYPVKNKPLYKESITIDLIDFWK
jgi:hypothetical protein